MRALRHLAVLLCGLCLAAPFADALTGAQRAALFGDRIKLSLDFTAMAMRPASFVGTGANGTRYDPTGVIVATSAPRFDYDPSTLAAKGLRIEAAATNLLTRSADLSNAVWSAFGSVAVAPVVTANFIASPDGSTTAAKVVFPAVSAGGGAISLVFNQTTLAAVAHDLSFYLKGAAGGEQLYLSATPDGATYFSKRVTLTTSWQRFDVTGTASAVNWLLGIGIDERDATQTSIAAQTIYAWGAQVETGAAPSSYVPTVAASVTRSADSMTRTSLGRTIIQRRNIATGTRDRIDAAAGSVTLPTGYWIERYVEYAPTVNAAYTGAHLTVDGPF